MQSLFSACPRGRYGKNCRFDCKCSGSECNPQTGECICEAGKMGKKCELGECVYVYCTVLVIMGPHVIPVQYCTTIL